MSGRLMGIDVGRVRVGVAFADPLGITITPHAVYQTAQGRAEKAIIRLISETDIEKIVVGMPYDKAGTKTLQCEFVEHFVARLKKRIEKKMVYQDEFLSSVEAMERMREHGYNTLTTPVDAFAAMVILEDYIRDNK